MANPERWEAFQVSPRAVGIDLKRSQFVFNYGNYVAEPAAEFRSGMLVDLSANGMIQRSVGAATSPFGVALYNKTNTQYAAVIDEAVTLTAFVASNLAHANLLTAAGGIAGVKVRSAVDGGGALYVEGVNYTMNYVNGTIVRLGGVIPDGATVYVSYQYQLAASDLKREGYNFWNFQDDVSIQADRITVITGQAIIFTTQYDPAITYNENAALYAGTTAELLEGLFTTSVTGGAIIGRVQQPPTAQDPWLGIRYHGLVA